MAAAFFHGDDDNGDATDGNGDSGDTNDGDPRAMVTVTLGLQYLLHSLYQDESTIYGTFIV